MSRIDGAVTSDDGSRPPLIVSALLGDREQKWLNRVRAAHFPLERNHLPAHLTLFHAVPADRESLVRGLLEGEASGAAPRARLIEVYSLGGGTALRVESEELEALRTRIAAPLREALSRQDAAPWRPHITVQNKVSADRVRELQAELRQSFRPCPLPLRGLALFRYRGGPWEHLAEYRFPGG